MRILGIDYGEKRVGVAIADTAAPVAVPRVTLVHNKKTLDAIYKIVNTEGIEQIIIGLPIMMSGEEAHMANVVRSFAKDVHIRTGLKVSLVDERWSSREAKINGAEDVDAAAAAVILQAWLDAQHSE